MKKYSNNSSHGCNPPLQYDKHTNKHDRNNKPMASNKSMSCYGHGHYFSCGCIVLTLLVVGINSLLSNLNVIAQTVNVLRDTFLWKLQSAASSKGFFGKLKSDNYAYR